MKKAIRTLSNIFLTLCFFTGCKTPPVQDQMPRIDKKINSTMTIGNYNNLKIFFPTFTFFNAKKGHTQVVAGDGMFLILPDGKTVIIDSFDVKGRDALLRFLKSFKITKIDYMFASHYHEDHIGGMEALLDNFEIGSFYSNGAYFNNSTWRSLETKLKEKKIPINNLKQGDYLQLSEEPYKCFIDVFWPQEFSYDDLYHLYLDPGKTEKLRNNSSLCFKLTYNDFSALFTGDIYWKVTRALRKKYKKTLKSTVLKIPHHGDVYTSNDLAFLKTVSPKVSVLQDNCYIGTILSTFCKLVGTELLYRETDGYILIETDGKSFKVSQTPLKPRYFD